MPIRALLLDLDDTLVVEMASADEAVHRACLLAAKRHGIHPDRLHESVFAVAHRIWYGWEEHPYAQATAVASWEALWARFEGTTRRWCGCARPSRPTAPPCGTARWRSTA